MLRTIATIGIQGCIGWTFLLVHVSTTVHCVYYIELSSSRLSLILRCHFSRKKHAPWITAFNSSHSWNQKKAEKASSGSIWNSSLVSPRSSAKYLGISILTPFGTFQLQCTESCLGLLLTATDTAKGETKPLPAGCKVYDYWLATEPRTTALGNLYPICIILLNQLWSNLEDRNPPPSFVRPLLIISSNLLCGPWHLQQNPE